MNLKKILKNISSVFKSKNKKNINLENNTTKNSINNNQDINYNNQQNNKYQDNYTQNINTKNNQLSNNNPIPNNQNNENKNQENLQQNQIKQSQTLDYENQIKQVNVNQINKNQLTTIWDILKIKDNTQAEHLIKAIPSDRWISMEEIKQNIKLEFNLEYKNEKSLYPYIKTLTDINLIKVNNTGRKRTWKKNIIIIEK